MSDEAYIHEPEHDHLLDNDDEYDDLHIFDGDEREDEHEIDNEFCENHTEDAPCGPPTTNIGGYEFCSDCAEDH